VFAGVGRYVHRGDPRWLPALPYARQTALPYARQTALPYARQTALVSSPPSVAPGATTGFLGIARNLGLGEEAVGAVATRAGVGDDDTRAAGRWGLFDAINVSELAERLFHQAETWLFENTPRIAALEGPVSFEPLTPGGLLVDGFDAWPAALLPYNAPYYPELVEAEGYEPARGWQAWTLRTVPARRRAAHRDNPDWRGILDRIEAVGYAEENAPHLRSWLRHLSGRAPFPAHPHLRWALALPFARAVSATLEAGACVGVPDVARALRLSRGHLFPIGYALYLPAVTRARRLGVFPAVAPRDWPANRLRALYDGLKLKAAEDGFDELVIAPVFEEDETSAEALSGLGAQVTQRFTTYEKRL
jgi:hypothetical protein